VLISRLENIPASYFQQLGMAVIWNLNKINLTPKITAKGPEQTNKE